MVPRTHHAGISAKIEPWIHRHQVHGAPHRFQAFVHGHRQVVAPTEHDGNNPHLHQFGNHRLNGSVGVFLGGSSPDVPQVHCGLPSGWRNELVQPMADGVRRTCAAFVVPRPPPVVDPKQRHASALQHGASVEAMGFNAVRDPRHPFRVGEVGGIDRFEQVEESVEHEPRVWGPLWAWSARSQGLAPLGTSPDGKHSQPNVNARANPVARQGVRTSFGGRAWGDFSPLR